MPQFKLFPFPGSDKTLPGPKAGSMFLLLLQLTGAVVMVHILGIEPDIRLRDLLLLAALTLGFQSILPFRFWSGIIFLSGITGLTLFAGPANAFIAFTVGTAVILLAGLSHKWIRYASMFIVLGFVTVIYAILPPWAVPYAPAMQILGVMFMFRLIIYLYDRQTHHITNTGFKDLSYFFMLPNMSMSLFPAVDYLLFKNGINQEHYHQSRKKGIQWIILGIFQLVLYRYVYHFLLIPSIEVTDLLSLTRYTVFNYVLIIRLSGLFHTGIGILCLMGFNLPRIFDNYFLASGFSDLWRRINIYFRDFLVKVFYYPLYFRLRIFGSSLAIVITILVLFIITWFLHSVQWFWIKRTFPIRLVDGIFWGIFGVLVAFNAWKEFTSKRNPKINSISFASNAHRMSKIVGTFITMSILWSLWTSTSMKQWLRLITKGFQSPYIQYIQILSIICAFWILSIVILTLYQKWHLKRWINPEPQSVQATYWSLTLLGILVIIPLISPRLSQITGHDINAILTDKLTRSDEERRIEGYYNEILSGHILTDPLMTRHRADIDFENEGKIFTKDFRHIAKQPGVSITLKGKQFTTNQWGMRDENFPLKKPSGTKRILLMGGSIVMGSGVSDEEVFDRRLQTLINMNSPVHYEFLNTATSSYDLIDCIIQFEKENLHRFEPDILAFFAHGVDESKTIRDITRQFISGHRMPYLYLDVFIHRAGLSREMTEEEIIQRLTPFKEEIVLESYARLINICDKHNIRPIWIYWPPIARVEDAKLAKLKWVEKVNEIGFTVIDLSNVFDKYSTHELAISGADMHPNAFAHKLVADELAKQFLVKSTE